MDLLDFDGEEMYFDQPLSLQVEILFMPVWRRG